MTYARPFNDRTQYRYCELTHISAASKPAPKAEHKSMSKDAVAATTTHDYTRPDPELIFRMALLERFQNPPQVENVSESKIPPLSARSLSASPSDTLPRGYAQFRNLLEAKPIARVSTLLISNPKILSSKKLSWSSNHHPITYCGLTFCTAASL